MAQSNRERVGRALELLTQGLRPFIEREMQAVHRQRWVEVANQSFDLAYRPKGTNWDASALLKITWDQWDMVFRKTLGQTERNLVAELRDTRNRWAHEDPFTPDDAYRALDSVQRLLQAISAPEAAEATRQKAELLRASFEQDARKATRQATLTPTEGRPPAGYKAWGEVITPHPDVASGPCPYMGRLQRRYPRLRPGHASPHGASTGTRSSRSSMALRPTAPRRRSRFSLENEFEMIRDESS